MIGLVEDGGAPVSAAADLSPDVIVADIDMPGLTGIDAAALIRRRNPDARIVFVTVHDDALMVERGLSVGALGYVLKETAGRELVPAVRAALAGERYVSRGVGAGETRSRDSSSCDRRCRRALHHWSKHRRTSRWSGYVRSLVEPKGDRA